MKLSDIDIRKKLEAKEIVIDPEATEDQIGSFSIDLQLSNHFKIFNLSKYPFIDLGAKEMNAMSEDIMEDKIIDDDGIFYLHPGEFALGVTKQRITLPNDIVGWLDGRSSLARVGLTVHITAHTVDPGWNGKLTLEFFNNGRLPLGLRPNMRICAISFELLTSPTSKPYTKKKNAKYKDQEGPLSSRIQTDNPE